MSFIVQNVSLALYGVDYESASDIIPQGAAFHRSRCQGHVEADRRPPHHRACPGRAVLVRRLHEAGQGDAGRLQDTEASAMMGINVNRTISITFFIAGALAAVAGLVFLLEYNIRYDTGSSSPDRVHGCGPGRHREPHRRPCSARS